MFLFGSLMGRRKLAYSDILFSMSMMPVLHMDLSKRVCHCLIVHLCFCISVFLHVLSCLFCVCILSKVINEGWRKSWLDFLSDLESISTKTLMLNFIVDLSYILCQAYKVFCKKFMTNWCHMYGNRRGIDSLTLYLATKIDYWMQFACVGCDFLTLEGEDHSKTWKIQFVIMWKIVLYCRKGFTLPLPCV